MMASQATDIVRKDVTLPDDQKDCLAFILLNVLIPEECSQYIERTEKHGYEKALVNLGLEGQCWCGRQMMMTDVRNSDRCIIDSESEEDMIWQQIKSYIPAEQKGCAVLGLNERLRFLHYDPGQYFKPHFDGVYMRTNGEASYITVQLYLNENFIMIMRR